MTSSRPALPISVGMLLACAMVLLWVVDVRAADPSSAAGSASSASSASSSGSETDCGLEVAQRVQDHYEQISDFEAEFEQITKSVAFGGSGSESQVAKGRVVMAKPGKMRWEYREPQESLVLSDGANLWIYDVAAKEAQHMVASGDFLSGAALQFLMGRGVIGEEFSVTSGDCSPEQSVIELDLLPRAPASYERLKLRVLRKTGEVQSTTLFDLFGNVTTISFRSVRINRDPPSGTFHFEPPIGVEMIELTPPQ